MNDAQNSGVPYCCVAGTVPGTVIYITAFSAVAAREVNIAGPLYSEETEGIPHLVCMEVCFSDTVFNVFTRLKPWKWKVSHG